VTRKFFFGLVILMLFALPLLAACAKEATPAPTATVPAPTATTPAPTAKANWWDKFGQPEYGGTLTVRTDVLPENFDPYPNFATLAWYLYESLFNHDWTLDRNVFDFTYRWTPPEYNVGTLIESWEWTDSQTCIAKVRQGVHWHNKPPTNGREFTAYDIEYHYDRALGTGHGYTTPLSYWPLYQGIEKVTAIDNYTVQFKFGTPSFVSNVIGLFDQIHQNVEAPEMVEQNLFQDWHNVVTTGPWLLTDYVRGTSMKLSRNPDYWANDERHPNNRLPYIDTTTILAIPDLATTLAALRTGRIDWTDGVSLQQMKALEQSNPEIKIGVRQEQAIELQLRCDISPYNDIKVRKALEMAIDRKTIAKSYYGGTVDGNPVGLFVPEYPGWCLPYDEWPADLKEEYSYNPAGSKQLLTEAGYPNGFKINAVATPETDLQLMQVMQSEFKDIGVDMEVELMDRSAVQPLIAAGKVEAYYWQRTAGHPPTLAMSSLLVKAAATQITRHGDTNFDAMVQKVYEATDMEEIKRLARDVDMYFLRQHWGIVVCPRHVYLAWQPYINGYSGEWLRWGCEGFYSSRIWINSDLKKSMGR
jgi:peptide/nickel transport system substrate-binding protein